MKEKLIRINNYINKYIDTLSLIVFILFIFSTSVTIVGYFSLHDNSLIPIIFKYIRFLCYGMCICIFIYKLLNKIYSINSLIIYFIIFIFSIIYFLISHDLVLVKSFLLSTIVYKTNTDKLIKYALYIQLVIFIFTIVLSKIGLIDNEIIIQSGRIRDFLGFAYTSFSGFYFLFTILLYINHRKEKVSYIELIIFELISLYLYMMTDTKYPFFITSLLLALLVFINLIPKLKELILKIRINKCIPFVIFALTLILVLLPRNEILIKLDNILSGRLYLAKAGLDNYGVSILGSDVTLQGFDISKMDVKEYNYVDSSYINILIRYGIINLFIILFIYVELIDKSIKNRDFYLLVSTLVILIVAVFDPYLYDLPFNVFPILAFSGHCSYEDNKVLNRISNKLDNIIYGKRK